VDVTNIFTGSHTKPKHIAASFRIRKGFSKSQLVRRHYVHVPNQISAGGLVAKTTVLQYGGGIRLLGYWFLAGSAAMRCQIKSNQINFSFIFLCKT
jgi:hypothetical protein